MPHTPSPHPRITASSHTHSARHRHSGFAGTSTLSIWLSVDPMSDKYPSTSPYTYCGNNPVRLVDPDGRIVEYNSFEDKLIVFISRVFDRSFRDKFNELKNSNEVYVFAKRYCTVENMYSAKSFLSTDGEKIFVNYFLSNDDRLGGETIFTMLKHETEHAMQFEYGELGFVKRKGTWWPLAYDLSDEYNAKVEMYKGTLWRTGENYYTWKNASKTQRIEGLHKYYGLLYYNEENPQLIPINITFKERRQDSEIYALPYRPRQ